MSENVTPIESPANEEVADGDAKSRQRSTIAFPYMDYEDAAAVARAIHTNVGHGRCSASGQLASWMGQSAKSSGFRTQMATARLFGLIESDDADSYRLTELGRRVVDHDQARGAKAEAFLRVPLFKALYEKYKGGVTPPTAALEREIVELGVAEKQKARARQTFEASAAQAGFREQGQNKLVLPGIAVNLDTARQQDSGRKGPDDPDGPSDLSLDPLLIALLKKIPQQGAQWPADKRLRWFKTFAMNVSQVYDEDDEPVELEISLRDPAHGLV